MSRLAPVGLQRFVPISPVVDQAAEQPPLLDGIYAHLDRAQAPPASIYAHLSPSAAKAPVQQAAMLPSL